MRLAPLVLLALAALPPLAGATHDTGTCVPTSADLVTYAVIVSPLDGRTFYDFEQNIGPNPFVPGGGFVWGDGSWIYEETNVLPGIQRGDAGLLGPCIDPFCTILDEDAAEDETCGHGADDLIVGAARGFVGP